MTKARKQLRELIRAQQHKKLARFYNISSILGNDWAIFYGIVGARMTGKSYAVAEWLTQRKEKLGSGCKNYWIRISETSTKAMLANNADKLIDPDIVYRHHLHFKTKGMSVYNLKEGQTKITDDMSPWIEVLPLSSFGKLKGVGFFDKDYEGEYNIILDEFQLEQGERRTSFDILYNFMGVCENLVRTTKKRVRVFLLGNTLEEASTIFKALNFIPNAFGRFYLRSKRAVIDNIEPTEEYLLDRKGSIADILGGENMSNYTNEIKKDLSVISKKRVHKPMATFKFSRFNSDWFVLWDGNVIKRWKNNTISKQYDVAMRPYLDIPFVPDKKTAVIEMFDGGAFKYDSLITYTYFKEAVAKVRGSLK